MKHLEEKDLLELAMSPEAVKGHAAECAECQARLEQWRHVLHVADAFAPPVAPDPAAVWQRLAPQLTARPQSQPRAWRPWAIALAAGIALAVFLLMRPRPVAAPTSITTAEAPSPVLRYAVAERLDRTQALLVELAHANELSKGPINLSLEKSSARSLLDANRLYHQSARLQHDAMLAGVLSSLEPPLLEIAHSPSQVPPAAWRRMQHRIAASGVLFKVRVLDQTLHAENGAL